MVNMSGVDLDNISTDDILAQLDKDTLSMVRSGKDLVTGIIPTASFGLNNLLGGGLRLGKQHTFWGNEQAGKSALMMNTVALNQSLGVPCAWVDAEHSFDPVWAARLGIDVDRLIISQTASIADCANLQVKLIQSGVKLLVVDSTSALKPKSFFDEDELKPFEKTGQIGQFAKDLGNMCSYVQGRNWSCAVVHISQVRMDLGNSFMPGMKQAGGKETEHTDQLRVRLFSSKSEKQAIMGKVQRGQILIEERIGRKVTWNVDKNKLNGRNGTGEYDLYTQGEKVGIDRASELLAYGIKYGVVNKGGAWFTIYDEKFNGEDNAKKHIRNNQDIADRLEKEIVQQSV